MQWSILVGHHHCCYGCANLIPTSILKVSSQAASWSLYFIVNPVFPVSSKFSSLVALFSQHRSLSDNWKKIFLYIDSSPSHTLHFFVCVLYWALWELFRIHMSTSFIKYKNCHILPLPCRNCFSKVTYNEPSIKSNRCAVWFLLYLNPMNIDTVKTFFPF